jgi:hypothetical protein
MNESSIEFIRQHWELIFHPAAGDFAPLIERSVLASVVLIVRELEKDDWRTIGELVEGTGIGTDTVTQITSALNGRLFEKFTCPEPGRGREVAVRLMPRLPAP